MGNCYHCRYCTYYIGLYCGFHKYKTKASNKCGFYRPVRGKCADCKQYEGCKEKKPSTNFDAVTPCIKYNPGRTVVREFW